MADWKRLTMDGTVYRVRIVYNTLTRAFELIEGVNAGDMMSGRHERDLVGTGYTYEMAIEPDPDFPADYNALFDAISAPVDSHVITVPYGQGTMTYAAEIVSGQDTYQGTLSGVEQWGGLTVTFRYISPQKEAGAT